jgi:hypothetical protein
MELGVREEVDTVILSLDVAHHALPPPVLSNSLRDNGSQSVGQTRKDSGLGRKDLPQGLKPDVL